MTPQILKNLIDQGEGPRCDFKKIHHRNKARLLHDILSLANANVDSNRYLIFGVNDNGSIAGVESDPNRRKISEISNLISTVGLNHSPTIKLTTVEIDKVEVDVLEIFNKPEKPYFLQKKYKHEGTIIVAGAIYTRSADTNTPIDKTADDIKLQYMFKERLGIDKTPLERLKVYLRDFKNWEKITDDENGYIFYYKPFPEFTLVENKEVRESFNEPWTQKFPAQPASMDEFLFKYHTTFLKRLHIVWCDDGKFVTTLPKKIDVSEDTNPILSYFLITDSFEELANRVIQFHCLTHSEIYIPKVIKYFDSDNEAKEALKKEYKIMNPNFVFYKFSKKDKVWSETVKE